MKRKKISNDIPKRGINFEHIKNLNVGQARELEQQIKRYIKTKGGK